MRELTASKLRANIYKVLDQVALRGRPVAVRRRGVLLKIVPPEKKDRLARLKKRNVIVGDPEDLVHINWETEWKPGSL
jgi:hypothetical protein